MRDRFQLGPKTHAMSKRFESEADLQREQAAIDWFVGKFKYYEYIKLGPNDIDFLVFKRHLFNANGIDDMLYIEVKGRNKKIAEAYPLPLAVRKIHALASNEARGAIIWACEDGYILGNIERLSGRFKMGGRKPRKGAANDLEPMVYFPKQENLIEYPLP